MPFPSMSLHLKADVKVSILSGEGARICANMPCALAHHGGGVAAAAGREVSGPGLCSPAQPTWHVCPGPSREVQCSHKPTHALPENTTRATRPGSVLPQLLSLPHTSSTIILLSRQGYLPPSSSSARPAPYWAQRGAHRWEQSQLTSETSQPHTVCLSASGLAFLPWGKADASLDVSGCRHGSSPLLVLSIVGPVADGRGPQGMHRSAWHLPSLPGPCLVCTPGAASAC